MVEALKKIDKKILIIAGIILLLPILLIIFLAVIQGCSNSSVTPEKYEENMIEAAKVYFDKEGSPKKEGEVKTVKLNTLVKKEYIKSTEKLLKDSSCEGSVSVRRNGSAIAENEGGYLNYIVNLECKDYKTNTLKNKLMEDLTTTGSGLYQDNNYYVYKGDEVNNLVKFYGKLYRVLNIDNTGIVKLLKVESESLDRYWDNKYNVEVSDLYGINIYADSAILKSMINDYNNEKVISKEARKHIVSNTVCIDSKDINDDTIGSYDCGNKLENQVVSLINIYDYAKASLDPNCNSITSKACGNYNYLKSMNLKSWTPNAVANNTYQIYYLTNSIIKFQEASKYQNYNLVIYIDGNEKITSGKGTEEAPFVIE